nr:MAG TPA: hypothetical protein [Caudoviricetes sp.]
MGVFIMYKDKKVLTLNRCCDNIIDTRNKNIV